MAPSAETSMWRRQRNKGALRLISMDYFDNMCHRDAPGRAEWTCSDMTLRKEFVLRPEPTSVRQHSDWIILRMKIAESKCMEILKTPKTKRRRKNPMTSIVSQNDKKASKAWKENRRTCLSVSLNENKQLKLLLQPGSVQATKRKGNPLITASSALYQMSERHF